MNEIGELIQKRRKELGLTLEEVGKAVNVGRSTVQRWESGLIKNMGRDKIAALANVLQINPVDLVPSMVISSGYYSEPGKRTITIEPGSDYISSGYYISKEDSDILEALHQDPQLRMLFDRARNMSQEDRDKMVQISGIIKGELYGE